GFEQRGAGTQRSALVGLDGHVLDGRVRGVHARLQRRELGGECGLRGLGGLQLLGDLVVLLDDLFQCVRLVVDLLLEIGGGGGGGRDRRRDNDPETGGTDEQGAH